MNKNMKMLKILRIHCEIRLFFEKLPKKGAPSAQLWNVCRIFLVPGARTVQNHDFHSAFVAFFYELAENVPPCSQNRSGATGTTHAVALIFRIQAFVHIIGYYLELTNTPADRLQQIFHVYGGNYSHDMWNLGMNRHCTAGFQSVSITPEGSQRDNLHRIRCRTHEPKWKVNHAAASLQVPKIVHLPEPVTRTSTQSKSFIWNTILGTV